MKFDFKTGNRPAKICNTLQRMRSPQIQDFERGLFIPTNRGGILQVEESPDIRYLDWRTIRPDIGLDPLRFSQTGGNQCVAFPKRPTFQGANQSLLPAMKVQSDRVIATFRHPAHDFPKLLRPVHRLPNTPIPTTMAPQLITRSDLLTRVGRLEINDMSRGALLAHYQTGDVRSAIVRLKSPAEMQDFHTFTLQHIPTTSTFSFPKTSSTARVTPKLGLGLP